MKMRTDIDWARIWVVAILLGMFVLIWGASVLAVTYEAVLVFLVIEYESMVFRAVLFTICALLTAAATAAALGALVIWGRQRVDELVPVGPITSGRPCTCERCTGLKKDSYYYDEDDEDNVVDFGLLECAGTSYDGDLR